MTALAGETGGDDTAESVYRIDNRSALLRLALVTVAYASLFLVAVLVDQIAVYTIVVIAQGFLLVGLFSAFHDTVHYTLFRQRALNVATGRLLGLLLVNSYTLYRRYHLTHHRYTGLHGDTEEHGEFGSIWQYLKGFIWPDFMLDVWKAMLNSLAGRYPAYVPSAGDKSAIRSETVFAIAWVILILAGLLLAPKLTLVGYVAPYMAYLVWFYLTALPEHYGCDQSKSFYENTRTTVSNPLFEFIYFNGNYHVEHHVAPGIPSYKLKGIHLRDRDRLKHLGRGYLSVHFGIIRDLLFRRGRATESRKGTGISI